MTRLGIEDVMELLDVQTLPGEPWQLERLYKWIGRLVEKRGKDYVWENRQNLLSQWGKHLKAKSEHCC
jgi:hypothetical protein